MPLVGGGGAGNFAGGNPSGVGSSLNYLKTPQKVLVFGYSGSVGVTNAGTSIMLKFTTGSESLLVDITGYSTHAAAHGDDIQFVVSIDSSAVAGWIIESSNSPNSPILPTPFVIAPYTTVEITAENLSGSTSRDVSLVLAGEAYA